MPPNRGRLRELSCRRQCCHRIPPAWWIPILGESQVRGNRMGAPSRVGHFLHIATRRCATAQVPRDAGNTRGAIARQLVWRGTGVGPVRHPISAVVRYPCAQRTVSVATRSTSMAITMANFARSNLPALTIDRFCSCQGVGPCMTDTSNAGVGGAARALGPFSGLVDGGFPHERFASLTGHACHALLRPGWQVPSLCDVTARVSGSFS
jgi:hypothetical protein